jgi:ACS family glucarate transporter-like MFS transporter
MSSLRQNDRVVFPLRYLLVFWLFILSAVAYLDRTNISIAGIQISKEFAIDNTHLGWVLSAFLIGYGAFQIPAGILAHRFGPRVVLTFAAIWWGLFTSLTALVPPGIRGAVIILVLVRFALGAGEAAMFPASSQFVERWFPVKERAKANGIIFGGVGAGSGFTPPLVTAIILRYGWRASFWFSAFLGITVGAVWYFSSRDTPEQHPLITENESALIRQGRDLTAEGIAPSRKASAVKRVVPWSKIFSSKEMIALTLSYFSFGYIAWIFFGWFYIYLAEVRGLNLKTSALYSMLPFIGMTVGCLLGGVLSDWLARRFNPRLGRCYLPASAMAVTAVLIVVGSGAKHAETASLLLAGGAGILYIAQSCFWAVTADFAGEFAGIASGIMNMGAQIGGALTASLTPLIAAHFGWHVSFFIAAFLALVGAVSWLYVNPHKTLATLQL